MKIIPIVLISLFLPSLRAACACRGMWGTGVAVWAARASPTSPAPPRAWAWWRTSPAFHASTSARISTMSTSSCRPCRWVCGRVRAWEGVGGRRVWRWCGEVDVYGRGIVGSHGCGCARGCGCCMWVCGGMWWMTGVWFGQWWLLQVCLVESPVYYYICLFFVWFFFLLFLL